MQKHCKADQLTGATQRTDWGIKTQLGNTKEERSGKEGRKSHNNTHEITEKSTSWLKEK